ncbi:Flp family type IVb pilin [Vogesella indigofera]|uniref:Flp family type IVb pilin n=1 Tax=Vogesella indigofera TaxID=45465 RepID=UPI00234EAF6B|nr:Flp family type IVb pilin [Vogesella indigofera]MDC7712181.1 Flp family type IVb pilin [Vogesella indigofera]
MNKYSRHLRLFLLNEDGVTAMEYALLGALIAVVIIVSVTGVGLNVQALFLNVADQVEAVAADVL